MRTRLILFLIFISVADSFCQNRSSVWCFGDSSLIDFSDTANILTGRSIIKSRGTCATICDSTGQLLFYTGYDTDSDTSNLPFKNGEIWNKQHQTMQNGDSVEMAGWYHEAVIINNPANANQYYVFSIGVTSLPPDAGIFYSLVDMTANGGLGEVIQKNVQLQTFKQVDCLTAIKHGNGRDWWIIFRKSNYPSGGNAKYYEYLNTPSGLSNVIIQTVGSINHTNSGIISFNSDGNKMIFFNLAGLMEYYDFDRCSGIISNPLTIFPEEVFPFERYFWEGSFSPSGNLYYITTLPLQQTDSARLIQFNLNATNIAASADTLWRTPFSKTMGQLKNAPDGKMYLATSYLQVYPYADSMYNYINENLSVINYPDSLGATCDLHKFSFNLGGSRTYGGLPNNPDYDMPADSGSICDTLGSVGIQQLAVGSQAELFVFYHSIWQKLFVNAQHLKGKDCLLQIFDMTGKEVYALQKETQPPYFTMDVNCASFAKGMYIVNLVTEKERLVKKFVKD